MKSFLALNYLHKEMVIVDGASIDETKDFLKEIEHHKEVKVISEQDRGIYDAMNKGIKEVQGDWVIFMNAGDEFFGEDILKDVEPYLKPENDIIYGNTSVIYQNDYVRTIKPMNQLKTLWKGMFFSHQSVFLKLSLVKQNPFNTDYVYCADFLQIYSLFLEGNKFVYADTTVAKIEAGGVSDNKRYKATAEVYRINRELTPGLRNHLYFIPKIVGSYIIVKLKSILPAKLQMSLIKLKYR